MITGEDVEAQSWQMALKPGDCYVNETPVAGIIHSDGSTEQFKNMPRLYCRIVREAIDVGPGFLLVMAYSEFEPGGERGISCIVDATRQITQEEFDRAVKELQNANAV